MCVRVCYCSFYSITDAVCCALLDFGTLVRCTPGCTPTAGASILQPQAAPSACVVYVVGRARLPAFVCRASARTLPSRGSCRSEPALVPPHSVQRVYVPRLVKVLPGAGVRRVENRPVRPRACQQGRSAGREVRHEALVRRKRQLKGWAHLLPRRIRAHRHALSALFSPFVYSRKPAGNTGVCELR